MNNKKYTYSFLVPLIGGQALGMMKKLNGQLPEEVITYEAFKGNDSHYVEYLKEKGWSGEYIALDETDEEGNKVNSNFKPKAVDIVGTTCPCAGLSSLSVSSNPESAVNDWMYESAEYALGVIQPKVFWGENAPRLSSPKGRPVANKLYEIAKKYGYSLTLYATQSRNHGNPQKRPRTFYFFTKSDKAPLFRFFTNFNGKIEDIFDMPKLDNDIMDEVIAQTNGEELKPSENPWVRYCMHMTDSKNLSEFYDAIDKTTNCIVKAGEYAGDNYNVVADWFDAQPDIDPKFGKRARAMQAKVNDGKGFWAHGVTVAKGIVPAFIGAMPTALINAKEDRFVTLREGLRIMGMPDDFNLTGENPRRKFNHMCQNVPVATAHDMMELVLDYLDGNVEYSESDYIKVNNLNHKVDYLTETKKASLEELFA